MVAAPVTETPSKVAAAQLDQLDLSKPVGASLTDKLHAAKEAAPAEAPVALRKERKSAQLVDDRKTDGRDRFVGNPAITCDADEPILKESGSRFVLFPIQYHEVRRQSPPRLEFAPLPRRVVVGSCDQADPLRALSHRRLGPVQARRGFLLDCRGGRASASHARDLESTPS